MFNGKTHYKWPFSIAMLNYQRVIGWLSDQHEPSRLPQATDAPYIGSQEVIQQRSPCRKSFRHYPWFDQRETQDPKFPSLVPFHVGWLRTGFPGHGWWSSHIISNILGHIDPLPPEKKETTSTNSGFEHCSFVKLLFFLNTTKSSCGNHLPSSFLARLDSKSYIPTSANICQHVPTSPTIHQHEWFLSAVLTPLDFFVFP